jgi:hypothetical protein
MMEADAPAKPADRLKLRAIDDEDLTVLAAFLQDAIANVSEMAYLPEEHRFMLSVCRFRWERAINAGPEDPFERVSCVITVDNVTAPKYRGFNLRDRGRKMPLLTVTYEDGAIVLTFGGDAAVRLEVEGLDLRMEDFGSCWPTLQKPEHADVMP